MKQIEERRKFRLQREQAEARWSKRIQKPEFIIRNLVRAGFFALTIAVLVGVYIVADAHLTEQFLAVSERSEALIDPSAGEDALTPENIEQQILALNLRFQEEELYGVAGSNPRPRPFQIIPGEPARSVAMRLEADGFITDAELFNLYLRVTNLDRSIEAGDFMLSNTMTMPEIADTLREAQFEQVLVTIPEGFRSEEIAERLAQNGVIDSERFLSAVRQPHSLDLFDDYNFLQNLPNGTSLEGYLFPDTYQFPVNASDPSQVLISFLNNFEDKVGSDGLIGGNSGLSGRDLLTLASIVEREAVQADERPLIAGVYMNRLNGRCPDVGGNYLQADPTVQYARGTVGEWWWEPESIEEYQSVISPYNTYLNPGLPPGPIASPGLSAVEATRDPAQSSYCFFVATGEDGRHVFAETLAQHQEYLQIYGYNP